MPVRFALLIVGAVPKTSGPVPVSSETMPSSCAEVVGANWAKVPVLSALAASAVAVGVFSEGRLAEAMSVAPASVLVPVTVGAVV